MKKRERKPRTLINKKLPKFNKKTRKKINYLCCFAKDEKSPKPS